MKPAQSKTTPQRLSLRRGLASALTLGVLLSSFGCGKNNKSDGASFETLPASPIVITADAHGWGGAKIKQPWFSFRVKSTNGTGDTFTLLAMTFTVSGVDKSGAIKMTDFASVPSDLTVTLVSGLQSYTCAFTHFGVWAPDESKFLSLGGDSTTLGSQTCSGWTPMFFLADNPSGPSGKSFVYNVRVKPLGWFGDYDNPSDRFETNFKFKTQ